MSSERATLRERALALFLELQRRASAELERLDGAARFREDRWEYGGGAGGGASRVLEDGAVLEKAGVNLAALDGRLTGRIATQLGVAAQPFHATGISLVVHPRSPLVPTAHMNLRYLELGGGRAWFGGGADLTPYYLFEEDAVHFHACLKRACDTQGPGCHARLKRACDDYFFLPHRGETRGIGGIFFDYLEEDLERALAFAREVGEAFLAAYPPIVERRLQAPYGERERAWQLARRGRYVEFNLVYDRGTLFGLETGGRTESILMSLPPLVAWPYGGEPAPGSPEAALVDVLRQPRDWAPA